MEDFKLTKKPDLDIFDRRFPAMFDDPIYDPTKMTIIQGTDGILDDLFSYQVYNKLKNHWRLDVEPTDRQPGMIWSDSDDDRLYHRGDIGGAAWEEILQVTRSSAVTPEFAGLLLAEYITHDGDADTYIRFQTDNMTLRVGGIDFIGMIEGAVDYLHLLAGKNFIGDIANAKMIQGLTINQAGNDDEILALKSTDVTHGITTLTETDTYSMFEKRSSGDGGVSFYGFAASQLAVQIIGVETTNNTTKSAAGTGCVQLLAAKKTGTNWGNMDADANLVAMRGYVGGAWATCWILDEDGDTWQNGDINLEGSKHIRASTRLDVEAGASGVCSSTIFGDQTAVAANMHIGNDPFQIKLSTAGNRKYKDNIKDLELDTSLLSDLRPISFTSKFKGDDKKKRFVGLIADEVEKIYPSAVEYNNKGEPDAIDYRLIQMAMLKETQRHETRIKALEAQLKN